MELFFRSFYNGRSLHDPITLDVRNEKNFSIINELVGKFVPKKNLRVLITGGSVAYGWGASTQEARFPSKLEAFLRERFPENNIEVINAGIPDFEAVDELALYIHYLYRFEPDIVIMFTGFNDIWAATKYQLVRHSTPRLLNSFQHRVISPTQSTELFLSFLRSLRLQMHNFFYRFSKFYAYFSDKLDDLNYIPLFNLSQFEYEEGVRSLQPLIYSIRAFHEVLHTEKIPLVVLLQPMRSLTNLDQSQVPISRYESKLRVLYRDYLRKELKKVSLGSSIYYQDLNQDFVDQLLREKCFIDFCHVNDKGNQLIADYIGRILERDYRLVFENRNSFSRLSIINNKIESRNNVKKPAGNK